jgi:hypothetical protein
MSSIGSPSPFLLGGKKSLTVSRSLRFNDNDSVYLNRTPSSTSNRKTFTISLWFKRGVIDNGGVPQALYGAYDNSTSGNDSYYFSASLDSGGVLAVGAWSQNWRVTTRRFLDCTAWYHLVVAIDTTQSTADNRVRIYVNGTEETEFGTKNNPSQDYDLGWNFNAQMHTIGRVNYTSGTGPYHYDGYIAEFNSIDGLQLTPSSFGETDATTGQWNPKAYSGSYGTNGFYLKFADNSGTTATTLGKDSSGNGNNFTPNNFSVSAGVGNDSLEDTPTNNFCTLNPTIGNGARSGVAPSNGNLDVIHTNDSTNRATFFFGPGGIQSGKWYWELKNTGGSYGQRIGLTGDLNNSMGSNGSFFRANNVSWFSTQAYKKYTETSETSSGMPGYSAGDVLGIAYDADNGEIKYYGNGSLLVTDSTIPSVLTNELYIIVLSTNASPNTWPVGSFNFGQRAFDYTAPLGYKKLNSNNLPDPTILKPNQHFDTLLWTANASTQTISGLNFSPDWVWGKSRDDSYDHELYDTVRGVLKRLKSNSNGAELTHSGNLQSFNSDGYTLGSQTNMNYNSGSNIVGWNWNAGDTDSKTYTVTVVNDSGNKYRFDSFGTSAVTLDLAEGGTYTFNYPSAHPLRFSTTSDGTHGGGSEYTTGVSTYGNSITITVPASAPTLYYYCTQHSGMGGQVNTNSTLGSSNFDGSVQTIVKANPTAGFSIISYAGNQSSAYTIGHGLGVAPNIIIAKSRTDAVNWGVYYDILGVNTNWLVLNNEDAQGNNDNSEMSGKYAILNSSTVQISYAAFADSGSSMIMYAFSEVAGYSKFGTYTGNGNTNGPFVYLGFRPAFLIIRASSTSGKWIIVDNKRTPSNPVNKRLKAESSGSEDGSYRIFSFLSSGFKLEDQYDGEWNGNGATFIYLAFAEAPFKYARAR